MVPVADVVDEKPRRTRAVRDEHVRVAVVVDVAERRAAPRLDEVEYRTRLGRDVLETATRIAEQLLALAERKRGVLAAQRLHVLVDVAIHGEQIEPAVVVEIEPSGAKAREGQARSADTAPRALFLEGAGAVVHPERGALADELSRDEILIAVAIEVARIDAHVRLALARRAECGSRRQRGVDERTVALVDPELVLLFVVRHEQIGPPVTVEIRTHHAQRRPELPGYARGDRHIGEPAAAHVAIEPAGRRAVHLRTAVVRRAGRTEARCVCLQGVVQVIADEEIEQTVAIDVHERCGHAPRRGIVRPRGLRHVRERAVPVVVEHLVAAEAGQVEIDPAVVVDVAGGHAHAVAPRLDAALLRHISEAKDSGSVRLHLEVVAIQPITKAA